MPSDGWTATERLDSFDCTLANLKEVVFECLEAAGASSVAEIGAENGLFTAELLVWARSSGAERVIAIDPSPRQRLRDLAVRRQELDLIIEPSLEALVDLEVPDAVILDGDHNYFTVGEELRLIERGRGGSEMSLVVLHDVGWPLGRRDTYDDPDRIPAESRQTIAARGFLDPRNRGLAEHGLYYERIATTEGGPRNGVLTALEDFVASRPDIQTALIAPFFGLAVVWHREAPWAEAMSRTVARWDRDPTLERAERKRVEHLVSEYRNLQQIDALRDIHYELAAKLLPIYESSALALAERLSRLRQGGRPNFSRRELKSILDVLAAEGIDLDEIRNGEKTAAAGEAKWIAPTPRPAGDSA